MSTSSTDRSTGSVPLPADLLDEVVAAVCRPADVPSVRAAVAEHDPEDLAALVAAVDQHQPMTLEVAVDVLAELDVPPTIIAETLGIDPDDVLVLLAGPLGPAVAPQHDFEARVIEVGDGRPADRPTTDHDADERSPDPLESGADEPRDPGIVEADGDRVEGATAADGDLVEGATAADGDPAEDAAETDDDAAEAAPEAAPETDGSDDPPVTVRIDEVAEDEVVAQTVADLEPDGAGGPGRARLVWALVLFVLVAGGLVAAALWWY